ncbi:MAG: tetratricopeptide repeat protein [Victivallales bacterium]|nr:tetratricopeptide repeat protein [Victivallales bacterium]
MSNNHTPQHTDPKDHELEQHEVKQVLIFLKHYGKLIGIGLLAAIVVILISKGVSQQKTNKIVEAEALLLKAQSPQELEEIASDYKSTPAAPVALLDLAKTHFNNGDSFQARAQYERFLKEYKKHELSPIADFGLANCSEADGDFDGAIAQFSTFIKAQEGHYLQSSATLALARSMEQANRLDEARIVLEDFLAENATSQWAGQAENALEQLGEK